jgi:polyisoprenoid-binding protein YceI
MRTIRIKKDVSFFTSVSHSLEFSQPLNTPLERGRSFAARDLVRSSNPMRVRLSQIQYTLRSARKLKQSPHFWSDIMANWIFEPGHTAAEFCARHMMVCWVRGHFKDVHGSLEFDPDHPTQLSVEATLEAAKLWSGEPQRDDHLRSSDFLDAGQHPTITFKSSSSKCVGTNDFELAGDLTVRGISRPVVLQAHYLGKWRTPYWTATGDAGPIMRVGFVGETRINRHDFKVSWNGELENGGVTVSDDVLIKLDVEALLESELNRALKKGGAE